MLFERLRMTGKNSRGCCNAGHEVESSRTRHLCLSQVLLSLLPSFFVSPAQVPLSLSSSFVSLKFLCPSCSSSHVHSKILVCSETIMLQKCPVFLFYLRTECFFQPQSNCPHRFWLWSPKSRPKGVFHCGIQFSSKCLPSGALPDPALLLKGRVGLPNRMNFRENSKWPLPPFLIFRKL